MVELVFASANEGKIKEIYQLLGSPFVIKGLKDVHITEEIPETGNTFYENAFLKANYVFEKTKKDVFADDSGLCIDPLSGEPGIHSAYYAGWPKDDSKNIELVLKKLAHSQNRSAHFISVISLIWKGKNYFFEGKVYGKIANSPAGNNGFGYDPIFIPDGYDQTFAELPLRIKNKLSHRYLAIQKMKEFLISKIYETK